MTGSLESTGFGSGALDAGALGRNPFVGPRPLEVGEPLYGREREIRELDHRLSADRIVLLHSPSGAGKSSLVQAGLLPRLRKSFDVWGPTRVNQAMSAELRGTAAAGASVNRYALSAMQGLEEGIPERLRRPPEILARQTLHDYLEGRPRRRSARNNVLLIFDQFEEILTADPLAVEAKRTFFEQLGELLRNPRVWALFVLREDYLAPLDPYAEQVPTHLLNRYRIDLLGLDGARQAMEKPAVEHGRDFPAAAQLVQDLAAVKIQQADGSFVERIGRHVEPVQLQVVCRRLWNLMPAEKISIEDDDLALFGDVTEALGDYYAGAVGEISDGDLAIERTVREWFGEQLITSGDIRSQVLRGAQSSGGLTNTVIARLLDTHLIRAEKRAGATWYELAHDRLIAPVKDNNTAWREAHLNTTQQRAALWNRQGQPSGLLLADADLEAAESWAASTEMALTEVERDFLEASRQAQAEAERERRRARVVRWLAVAASIAVLVAAALLYLVASQKEAAEEARQEAETQRLAADAQREEADLQRAKAERESRQAEAARREAQKREQDARAAEELAREEQARADAERERAERSAAEARRQREAAQRSAESAQAALAAAETERQRAEEEKQRAEEEKDRADANATKSETLRRRAEAHEVALVAVGLPENAPDELPGLLAIEAWEMHRSSDGEAQDADVYGALWEGAKRLRESSRPDILRHSNDEVRVLALSPAGEFLASAGEEEAVRLVDLRDRSPARRLEIASEIEHLGKRVRALSFVGAERLFAGTFGGDIVMWNLETASGVARPVRQLRRAHEGSVTALAARPGSSILVSGGRDGSLRLWDVGNPPQEAGMASASASMNPTIDVGGAIFGLAWAPDGSQLAVVGESGLRILLAGSFEGGAPLPGPLGETTATLHSVVWGQEWLAVGEKSGAIRLWKLADGLEAPATVLASHTAAVTALALHPQGGQLASASLDGSVGLWALDKETLGAPILIWDHAAWVWEVAYSKEGERIYSGSSDRTVRSFATHADQLAKEICGALPRQLEDWERDEYLPADLPTKDPCAPWRER